MPGDALDDLLDDDEVANDIFRDVDTNMNIPSRRKAPSETDGPENSLGLGIDEEVKITKKKKPIVKLDENRLLSQAGIPKLRRIAKERFRFKGKGHEYSDIARLLNIYQLWLDDLYPRAKFADALAIIEKLGHSKRIQTMRKEWINEANPQDKSDGISKFKAHILTSDQKISEPQNALSKVPELHEESNTSVQEKSIDQTDDYDIYSATPPHKCQQKDDTLGAGNHNESLILPINEKDKLLEVEDELDALLAEEPVAAQNSSFSNTKSKDEETRDNFDHEMEAMEEMDDIW